MHCYKIKVYYSGVKKNKKEQKENYNELETIDIK